MGKYTIDLATRYQNAFGFVAKNVAGKLLGVGLSNSGLYTNIQLIENKEASFDEMILTGNGFDLKFGAYPFVGGNYGLLDSLGILGNEESISDVFAPPPMFTFSRGKNIKTTAIPGSDAEVVENYGLKSWQIKMQGLLIDMKDHTYPSQQIQQFRKVFEVGSQFDVESEIFDDLGIYSIYFTEINSLSGVEGFEDTWKYSITARSISPVEFGLK